MPVWLDMTKLLLFVIGLIVVALVLLVLAATSVEVFEDGSVRFLGQSVCLGYGAICK